MNSSMLTNRVKIIVLHKYISAYYNLIIRIHYSVYSYRTIIIDNYCRFDHNIL